MVFAAGGAYGHGYLPFIRTGGGRSFIVDRVVNSCDSSALIVDTTAVGWLIVARSKSVAPSLHQTILPFLLPEEDWFPPLLSLSFQPTNPQRSQ